MIHRRDAQDAENTQSKVFATGVTGRACARSVISHHGKMRP